MNLPLMFWVVLLVGLVAIVLMAIVLIIRVVASANRRTAERMIADFMQHFPGKCMLCSYHRHALLNGADFPLGPHFCLEGNSPPGPIPTAKARAQKWTRLP